MFHCLVYSNVHCPLGYREDIKSSVFVRIFVILLPPKVKEARSLDVFKAEIGKYLKEGIAVYTQWRSQRPNSSAMTVLNGGAGMKGQVAYSSIIHVFPIIVGNFYSKIFYVATMSMITFFGPAHVIFGHFDSVPGIYC